MHHRAGGHRVMATTARALEYARPRVKVPCLPATTVASEPLGPLQLRQQDGARVVIAVATREVRQGGWMAGVLYACSVSTRVPAVNTRMRQADSHTTRMATASTPPASASVTATTARPASTLTPPTRRGTGWTRTATAWTAWQGRRRRRRRHGHDRRRIGRRWLHGRRRNRRRLHGRWQRRQGRQEGLLDDRLFPGGRPGPGDVRDPRPGAAPAAERRRHRQAGRLRPGRVPSPPRLRGGRRALFPGDAALPGLQPPCQRTGLRPRPTPPPP